jgi:3-methylcrotonyl-CoA carboxylase alpha subunit
VFRKILIANRGEIACRVIRTARRMGVATVGVYSDADAHALHITMADEAYRIGPALARESYLNAASILAAARRAGAEALHPGYGFLAENAEFAEACGAAGIVFIGPPPAAIRAMGGKSEAKSLMERAGVPVVPGYHGEAQDEATLAAAAARIGYPVLIKASAGGGGKGMRVVERADDFAAALAGARRETLSSFGDDRVLIERYLVRPRHIEMQIFADTHGNIVHLFERDCSIQRRHQKIIEEAPAPGMTQQRRREMGEAAIAATRAIGYVGAGTVEFIAEGDAFYFMEMNARLQVEHPVTEMITGEDLVEWQLRVASGEELPLKQDEIPLFGHAFEARIYAEDPERGFIPSVGRLVHLRTPPEDLDTRIDTGVREGDWITPYYDPMIAKLIVHGEDRPVALRRLIAALGQFEVVGVATNLPLLRSVAAHPAFARGDVETGFIPRNQDALFQVPSSPPAHAVAGAALAIIETRAIVARSADDPYSPWSENDSWRLNLESWQSLTLHRDKQTFALRARAGKDETLLEWDGVVRKAGRDGAALHLDDETRPVSIVHDGKSSTVLISGTPYVFDLIDPLSPARAETAGAARVLAPIPGRVASILTRAGDTVARGQVLVVLEAMKMELSLTAARDGTVQALRCTVGDMVEEGRELIELAEVESN